MAQLVGSWLCKAGASPGAGTTTTTRKSGDMKSRISVTRAITSHFISAAKTFVLRSEHSGQHFPAQKHMKELVTTTVTISGLPSACLL